MTRPVAASEPSSPSSQAFDASFLASIQERIHGFGSDPIPLIEGTPSSSRIKMPNEPGVRRPRTAAVLVPL